MRLNECLNKMPCHHHSRVHQPHMATVVIKLFVLFTILMLSAMLPNQFTMEKTAISAPNYVDGNAAFVYRAFAFFAFQVKLTWKFISMSAAQCFWSAAVPSAFLSIATCETAAAAADDAVTTSTTPKKLITLLHGRFIIIGVWWTVMLAHYLDQSIRNMREIYISCYPSATFSRNYMLSNGKIAAIATIVGVLLLKIILIKIYWRTVNAFVGCRTDCRPKMKISK